MKNVFDSLFRKLIKWRFIYCFIEHKYYEQFQFIKSNTPYSSDYDVLTYLIDSEYSYILETLHDHSDEDFY